LESVRISRDRLRWWTELPLVVVVYAAYSAGRLLARGDISTAVDHGLAILRFEQWLRIDVELLLNRLFTVHAWLGVPADFVYASLHYLVTPAVLIWVFRRHSGHYRTLRTWLLISTLIGLVGFTLAPTCPPRLLDAAHGFVDTMAQYGHYGWWGGEASAPRGLGGLTNQYAAMPSLHVGWALWCGAVLWRLGGRGAWTRTVAAGYPLLITVMVLGTANHYLLDAVAGAAVMGLGLVLTRPALRCVDRASVQLRRHAPAHPAANAPATNAPAADELTPDGPALDGPAPEETSTSFPGTVFVRSTDLPGQRSGSLPPGAQPPVPHAPAPASQDLNSTIVTGGCHTSPGERHPRQPTDDSPAPAAR